MLALLLGHTVAYVYLTRKLITIISPALPDACYLALDFQLLGLPTTKTPPVAAGISLSPRIIMVATLSYIAFMGVCLCRQSTQSVCAEIRFPRCLLLFIIVKSSLSVHNHTPFMCTKSSRDTVRYLTQLLSVSLYFLFV